MKIRLELDEQAAKHLIELALQERRPVDWQAEVLLREALGLAGPAPCGLTEQAACGQEVDHDHERK